MNAYDQAATLRCSIEHLRAYCVVPPWLEKDAGAGDWGDAAHKHNAWSQLSVSARDTLDGLKKAQEEAIRVLGEELARAERKATA